MKYWQLKATNDGVVIYADIKRDHAKQTVFADTTNKDCSVEGNLNDDYPHFSGLRAKTFSQRLTAGLQKLNPEGIMIRPVTLKLPDGSLNHSFCEVTVSAHVDCVDFNASTLKFNEDDGSIRFIKKLILNAEKAQLAGYDIFRLHDDFPTIIVSDRLKQVIEAISPIGVRFKPTDGSE